MNRDIATIERSQFLLVIIDENYFVTEVGKTSAGDQSYIS